MLCTGSVVTRTVRFIVNLFLLYHYFNIQIPYFVFQIRAGVKVNIIAKDGQELQWSPQSWSGGL